MKTETIASTNAQPIKWEILASDTSEGLSITIIQNGKVDGHVVFNNDGSVSVDYPGCLICTFGPSFKLETPEMLLWALWKWTEREGRRSKTAEVINRMYEDIEYLYHHEVQNG
jgi:hypothetical protein